jgi:hypothetical protein
MTKKILIFTILILGLGLYGCGKNSVPVVNQNQNVNVATTTGEIDTSDWKTYRNEEFGFEFKHPLDWKLIDGNPVMIYDSISLAQKKETELMQGAKMEIYLERSAQDLNDYVFSHVNSSAIKNRNSNVDGIESQQFFDSKGIFSISTFFKKNNLVYSFLIYIPQENSRTDYINIYNSIIGSINFY